MKKTIIRHYEYGRCEDCTQSWWTVTCTNGVYSWIMLLYWYDEIVESTKKVVNVTDTLERGWELD